LHRRRLAVNGHFVLAFALAEGHLTDADVYYPLHRLALEYDGSSHRENLTGDNRRQNRMVDAGFRVLRFTAADVLCPTRSWLW
jgi:very-short-patch-repair endonuclease